MPQAYSAKDMDAFTRGYSIIMVNTGVGNGLAHVHRTSARLSPVGPVIGTQRGQV
jgi:hypothetical protein